MKSLVEFVDRSGFHSVWIEDHYSLPPNEIEASEGRPLADQPLEAWTTLAAISTWTTKVKLGTEVTPMTIRHPGILAKFTANLDIMSKGRLILGAGAGWNRPEFVTLGIPFENAELRFEKMREAIDIVKLLWTMEKVDFNGKFYELRNALLSPKPLRKPHPPIWFGGFSERILSEIARSGDGWINATNQAPELVANQIERLAELLSKGDRHMRIDELDVSVPLLAMVHKERGEAHRRAEEYMTRGKFEKTLRFFADTLKYGAVGTPEDCVERIGRYVDLGVNHIIFDVRPPSNALPTLRLISEAVLPQYR